MQKWLKKNTKRLDGRMVAISGSTGGLGRELCRYLASLGASLVLLDRNSEKSNALAKELREEFEDLSVTHIRADMEDISSVKVAADGQGNAKANSGYLFSKIGTVAGFSNASVLESKLPAMKIELTGTNSTEDYWGNSHGGTLAMAWNPLI